MAGGHSSGYSTPGVRIGGPSARLAAQCSAAAYKLSTSRMHHAQDGEYVGHVDPAVYELNLDQVPDVEQLLATVNTPTAGPPVSATIEGNRVVFVCETWRPILEARIADALAAG